MAYKAITGIYKIENLINGKVYIGLSVNIKRRWKDHKKCVSGVNFSEYGRPLYRAMRKYGVENFKFEILEECRQDELEERESFYIEKYRSYERDFGYNISRGGETGALNKLTWKQVEEITELLKNSDLNQTQIGDLYSISPEMVNGMNTGRFYRRDIEYPIVDYSKKRKVSKGISQVKCLDCGKSIGRQSIRCLECQALNQRRSKRPEPKQLLEEVALYGFEAVGRQHGVSGNSVKKWMKSYGLPHLIKDVKILYGNYRPPKEKQLGWWEEIKITKDKEEYFFSSTDEAASFFINNKLTTAKRESVKASIARALRGDRKTYLGYTITGKNTLDKE